MRGNEHMANVEMTAAELLEAGERDLGESRWMRIDQTRIDLFADATDDHQWIHVDPQRAKDGPFGTTVAHGYLTLSLLPRFLEDVLAITDEVRGTNYGVDRARFTSPVPEGSELRIRGTLRSATARDDGGVQYRVGFDLEIRGQERPALVGEVIYLTYPA